MTISPQWAEYIPSTPVDESVDAAPGRAPTAYSTVWTHVAVPDDDAAAYPSPSAVDDSVAARDTDDEALSTVAAGYGHQNAVSDVRSAGVAGYGPDDEADEDRDPTGSLADDEFDNDPSRVGEYTAMPGIPGRGVCLLTIVAAGSCAVLDLALTRGITLFFDLCFVTICLVAALSVRRRDLFTTGVMPPLIFAAVVGVVAALSPGTFVAFGGASKAFMTGLAQHAPGLVAGYAVALLTVGSRVSASRGG
jgi:Domain of unknown function (DUF6542)